MGYIFLFVVVCVVIYMVTASNIVFLIEINKSDVFVKKGNISNSLLSDFKSVLSGVNKAIITGRRSDNQIVLSFKGDINDAARQRIQNLLGIYLDKNRF